MFCETKRECNELAVDQNLKEAVGILHGDIPQNSRETTLKAFARGDFKCLVATDVAARGLHVDNVAVVINAEVGLFSPLWPAQPS